MPHQPRILIVDDDYAIRTTLQDVLEALGYVVTAVGNGSEGIEIAKSETIDVAIVDLRLPDIDGTDVVKAIKRINGSVECIVITAYSKELPEGVVLNGTGGYFAKPLNLDKMLGAIKKLSNN